MSVAFNLLLASGDWNKLLNNPPETKKKPKPQSHQISATVWNSALTVVC